MFQQEDTILPVSALSAGYQSLIWMVFDIAYRMALLNPQLGCKIAQTKGVVLIDELDMHLHPRWQWNIIHALRTVFPEVQFIATTHAPILFASAKDVNVIDIGDEEVKYKKSHFGIDINSAVEEFQNTSECPSNIKLLTDEIQDMLDCEDFEKAERLLERLEKELGDGHPVVIGLKSRLELEKIDWGD